MSRFSMGKRCVEQKVYWGSLGKVVVIYRRREKKTSSIEAAAPRRVNKTTCTHVYDEVLHRQRPRQKRHVISKFVFVLLEGGRRKRERQSNTPEAADSSHGRVDGASPCRRRPVRTARGSTPSRSPARGRLCRAGDTRLSREPCTDWTPDNLRSAPGCLDHLRTHTHEQNC